MKVAGPTGWRGVMNRGPQPSNFGLSPLADNVDSLTQRPRVRVSRIRHGIGGGMRLSEDSETTLFSSFRGSNNSPSRRLSFSGGRAAVGVYAAMLVAGLLVVHVHLRFEILDMNIQQHALQTVHRQLEREASMLESRFANLNNLGRLKDHATRKLQMQGNAHVDSVNIAPSLVKKYSAESVAADQQEQAKSIAAAQSATNNPFRRFANMALAFAENGR